MNVATILYEKARQVVTADAQTSIRAAITLMSINDIGSIVVLSGNGKVQGLLIERDLIHSLSRLGSEALEKQVGDLVRSEFVRCDRKMSTKMILKVMTDRRARHAVVFEDGELFGLLSIGDVVKHHVENAALEIGALRDRAGVRSGIANALD